MGRTAPVFGRIWLDDCGRNAYKHRLSSKGTAVRNFVVLSLILVAGRTVAGGG